MTRNLLFVVLAGLALVACKKDDAASNPKPAAPAQQQQPAAQPAPAPAPAPAAQEQPAAEAPAAKPAAEVSPEAMNEAKQTFSTVCSTCHGPEGKGDGPAAAGFPVKPRTFSDAEWQKTVTDEHLAKVILEGGPAVNKSPLMPGNPQLQGKPEVVQALVKLVREMGGQK